MAVIPTKVEPRLVAGIKKFQAILSADPEGKNKPKVETVTEMLEEVFGFEKDSLVRFDVGGQVTRIEIAIKSDCEEVLEVEIVSTNTLQENPINFSSNAQTIADCLVLTNGLQWKVFRINQNERNSCKFIYKFDFLALDSSKLSDLTLLLYVCKENFDFPSLKSPNNQESEISVVLNTLNSDIKKRSSMLFWAGLIVLGICILIAALLYYDIKDVLTEQIDRIDNAKDAQKALLITIYLLFRVITLGAIPTALLIFGYNVVKASLDQSIRFAKRQHGALFWQFLHDEYGNKVQDITFDKFKDAFDTWNKATESSFTSIKISGRNHFGVALENITNQLKEIIVSMKAQPNSENNSSAS